MPNKPLTTHMVGLGSPWWNTETGALYRQTTSDLDDPPLTAVGGSSSGAATDITVTPTGNLAADDVQEALVELQTELDTMVVAAAGVAVGPRTLTLQPFGATTDVTTGDLAGGIAWAVPALYTGWNITQVESNVVTAGTTGTTDIQLRRIRGGSSADVLSTKSTIDTTETSSATGATASVVNTSNDDLVTADLLVVDVDAVSTTKPKGLTVTVTIEKP
jgi:hypothetical protein